MVPENPTRDGTGLERLRSFREKAPWNIKGLAAVARSVLRNYNSAPVNSAAAALPGERTIRYYVSRGLVTRPDGRGTSATYRYRHLLQILYIKLRQAEGGGLDAIASELHSQSGDVIEHRVANTLGRFVVTEDLTDSGRAAPRTAEQDGSRLWSRIAVLPGVELHLSAGHPLAEEDPETIAESVRRTLNRNGRNAPPAP